MIYCGKSITCQIPLGVAQKVLIPHKIFYAILCLEKGS